MRPRCSFTYVGRPTTAPNTPDDVRRIALSQWLTRLIGDDYVTPGANGYTAAELANAEQYYAHLKGRAQLPESELQMQAVSFLRAGLSIDDIVAELQISSNRLTEWRKDSAFLADWEAAKDEGKGLRLRSSARHDAQQARRVDTDTIVPLIAPPMPSSLTVATLQAIAIEKLRSGLLSVEVIKQTPGLNGNKLAAWNKDPAFAARWKAAKAEGRTTAPKKQAVPRKEAAPAIASESKVTVLSAVDGPAHYGGTEVYDQMLHLFGREAVAAFCRLNAYKYRMRAGKKPGNSIEQDIGKAIWYESRLQELAA